ncbi:hemerythrin [Geomonas limicola]|uniref:Hemerythrin n=1 Tax=Geomonas limicola TaxID=2740186 RepID=A0A6V8N528_9BACT|nr:hemerythrin family protein [Geomonas limicola]GFO67054.1 hemerythrin [Geomonas limicola]
MFTKCSAMVSLQSHNPKWRTSLETGDVAIDRQHRELLEKINQLLLCCTEGTEKEQLAPLLGFLRGYVRSHFEDEETFQRLNNCPGYQAHKRQHDQLLASLETLDRQFLHEGASLAVVSQTLKLTYRWMVEHIYHEDQTMVQQARCNQEKERVVA